MKISILCFGGPILDSYLLIEEGIMEQYGISKGCMAIYDDLTPPENVKKMFQDFKFTDFEMGGSAVNTAKAYAMLGGSVGLACSYGDDDRRKIIESEATKLGIKMHSHVHENAPTSYLMILVTPDAQRTVCGSFYPSFQPDSSKLDYSCVKDYDYSFIESYSFTNDEKHDSVFKSLESIEKHGKKFIFALSNAFVVSKFKDVVSRFLHHENCKVVIGNAQEFLGMYDQFKDIQSLVNYLLEYNKKQDKWDILIITDGEKGAYIIHKHEMKFVPPPQVNKVIDTTGAGDYFAAGALVALLNGYGLNAAATLSNMLASDIISKVGVKLSDEVVSKAKQYLSSL